MAKKLKTGENEGPEQERALHARPCGGELIRRRQVAAGMAGHVVEIESVGEEKGLQQAESPQNHQKSSGNRAFRAESEIQPAGPAGQNAGHRRVEGGGNREPDEENCRVQPLLAPRVIGMTRLSRLDVTCHRLS